MIGAGMAVPRNDQAQLSFWPPPAAKPSTTVAIDLADVMRRGVRRNLYDIYGRLDLARAPLASPEVRIYDCTARIALDAMRALHCRPRSGTHYRMAGAILLEMEAATECAKCGGAGRVSIYGRTGMCPACIGSGLRPAAIAWRAGQCECRFSEFRDNLNPAYSVAIARLAGIRRGA